jgi:hypothetical protein
MNKTVMSVGKALGIGILFIAPYVVLNTLAMKLFPELAYFFNSVHVLLIPHLTLFLTLTTYYTTGDSARVYQTFLYSLAGSSLLVSSYFLFPVASEYVKMIATFALPALAIYNYFSTKNS